MRGARSLVRRQSAACFYVVECLRTGRGTNSPEMSSRRYSNVAADEARSRMDAANLLVGANQINECDVGQGVSHPDRHLIAPIHRDRGFRLRPNAPRCCAFTPFALLHSASLTYEADTTVSRGRRLVKARGFDCQCRRIVSPAGSPSGTCGVRVCHATKVGWVGSSSGLEADQPTNSARGVSSVCSPTYVADVGSASNSLRALVDASAASITGTRPIVCISAPTTPPSICLLSLRVAARMSSCNRFICIFLIKRGITCCH